MDKSTLHMKGQLVKNIESSLGWGPGDSWSNKDFEELSERIFIATNKRLSVTTLKRIWGRAKWVANPSIVTLDILSEFIGHESWRAFVKANKNHSPHEAGYRKAAVVKSLIPILGLLVAGFVISLIWRTISHNNSSGSFNSEDYRFKSRPVSEGIPNSVVFDYDASAAGKDSKVEIQQYWDKTKRMSVSKADSIATSIYYYPGFFKSKLVVDDSIVKENDVFITTNDWLGLIKQEPRPIYLSKADFLKGDTLAITPDLVSAHDLDPRTEEVFVSFYQVKDFGEVYTDNFEFSITLKNDFEGGLSGACQRIRVYILYNGGALGIPLSKLGCVSEATLLTFEGFVDGRNNDLSGFGVDFRDYVELRCISRDQNMDILVNGKKAFRFDVPETGRKIKGISIHFEGAGSVQGVSLRNEEGVAYEYGR